MIFLISIFLGGCVDTAEVDLDSADPRLIVEGKIANGEGPFEVKLSLSTEFFNTLPEYVETAEVFISDDAGNVEQLQYTEKGTYVTSSITGVPGYTYHLRIEHAGKTYEAWSHMPQIPELGAIEVTYEEESFLRDEGYYLIVRGEESDFDAGYYRSLVYVDDSLYNPLGLNDLFAAISEDGEGINQIEIPYAFRLGDSITLEIISMDRRAYVFYQSFLLLLFSDGGLFGSPPANPEGNISNGALGLFQAVSFIKEEVEVK